MLLTVCYSNSAIRARGSDTTSAQAQPFSLRRNAAFCDLPSRGNPKRAPNPPSYAIPAFLPTKGPNERPLPPSPPLRPPEAFNNLVVENIEIWLSKLPEDTNNMFQFNEKYASIPFTPGGGSPPRSLGGSRFRSWSFTPRKLLIAASFIASLVFLNSLLSPFYHPAVSSHLCLHFLDTSLTARS